MQQYDVLAQSASGRILKKAIAKAFRLWLCVAMVSLGTVPLFAQITNDRLLNTDKEPQNWLMFSGSYRGLRYSLLNQITPANAKDLEVKWVFQPNSLEKMEVTPLVVDGVMYLSQSPNGIVALDAATGRIFWIYQYHPATNLHLCCGLVNRGLAISGNTLYMGTVDAHLLAVDARNGRLLWNVKVANEEDSYAITQAPLVVKDKVIVGMAGAERGVRGFITAFSTKTGEQLWKFNTIPGPGEAGHETWSGDTWKHGGGSSWITGSYDPDLNLVFYGIGNPFPDMTPEDRPGDNLYTCSAIALDPDTGELKWHFQFTPNDGSDWDSMQVPVLAEIPWEGSPRKVILWANRNGFFYVLDRATGKFLRGAPFVKQNWAVGLDPNGRPIRTPGPRKTTTGAKTYPGSQGGTNWFSPSYSPHTRLFYLSSWEDYYSIFPAMPPPGPNGRIIGEGFPKGIIPAVTRVPINTWTDASGHGEVKALDPVTGKQMWAFRMNDMTDTGVLTTAADLLFSGNREGYVFALDARNGNLLWKFSTGNYQISATPMTYSVDGKQYIAISAGHTFFVFGLRD